MTYTYDAANRVETIVQGTTTVTYGYDAADRRTSVTLPNGLVVETGYDAASRVTSLTYRQGASVLGDLTYTYNAAGERVEVGGTFARTGLPAAVTSAVYDAANRLTTWAGTPVTYDLNGNLTSDGVSTFTWDARDRLVGVAGAGVSGVFSYDAVDRRTQASVNGTATGFLHDGLNPVQELNGTTPTANLLTGLGIDEFLSRDTGTGPRTFLPDGLGSTMALMTPGGAIETSYAYEPFGAQTTSGTPSSNRFGFTGREADGTGLMYYRARYYSPTLQRFVSEDPAEFVDGPQLYAYVGNAPTNFWDPLGLEKLRPCTNLIELGNVGSIFIDQPSSGRIRWGVELEGPIFGVLTVFESYRSATTNRRYSNTSRPYPYAGPGGTTHGSRGDLKVGSEYRLRAALRGTPMRADGSVRCTVQ